MRDNTESIAFYQGEESESSNIAKRFRNVLKNFNLLIGWQRNLSFFTTAYSYLPFLVLFPQYFSVGHRSSILEFHSHVLDLQGRDIWRLWPVAAYQSEKASQSPYVSHS